MIHSMTAFARQASQGEWGTLVWEIRTINHRYLECSFKLPESLTDWEFALREQIKQQVQRGKMDVSLRLKTDKGSNASITINTPLLDELIALNQSVKAKIGEGAVINTMHILAWPDIIQKTEFDYAALKTQALAAFDRALQEITAMRQREGQALAEFIEQRLQAIEQYIEQAKVQLPLILVNQRSRLQDKLAEVMANLDPARIEQELVLFAQRIDIEEELNRLAIHTHEVRRSLNTSGPQGRRLDFLMQELNREANTLGAKAGDAAIANIAISLKVLIEQMREQVQNIE